MTTRKHITIYDIAREAQVSPATVSRILTGSGTVREEKRRRVQELIDKYNFHPNAMARALSETHSHLIGMMVADVGNPYYNSLFTACVNEAYKRGYATMLFNTLSRAELEDAAMTRLREQRADAIIISGGRIDLSEPDPAYMRLLDATLETTPLVVASQSPDERIYGVEVDHKGSVDLAVDYLTRLGHKDIGFVYTGSQFYGTRDKVQRFRECMAKAGLTVREECMVDVAWYDTASGVEGADKILSLDKIPTAVLSLNDVIATGLLHRLLERGVKVPQEMSVMCFDDTFITDIMTPQLTAVGYDYDVYASMLLDAAVCAMEGREIPRNQVVPSKLLIKQSTAAPSL